MFCLRCNSQMKRGNLKGILADFCPNCRSFWLDKNELNNLRQGEEKNEDDLKKELKREKKYEPLLTVKNACPRCFGELISHVEGSVRLDKCTRCEGMFFDKGELDQCLKEEKVSFVRKIINAIGGEVDGRQEGY